MAKFIVGCVMVLALMLTSAKEVNAKAVTIYVNITVYDGTTPILGAYVEVYNRFGGLYASGYTDLNGVFQVGFDKGTAGVQYTAYAFYLNFIDGTDFIPNNGNVSLYPH